jgi:RNA polymerase sigma-70 factor, ECF subfamily
MNASTAKIAAGSVNELSRLERRAYVLRSRISALRALRREASAPDYLLRDGTRGGNPISDPPWTDWSVRGWSALKFVMKKIDSSAEERSRTRARLMARMQDGDGDSCRVLLDDIGPLLMNFLRRRIADRDALEDVYQETIMALFQARHTYDPARPLEPWLFAIARNVAADHARHFWTRASFEQLTDNVPEQLANSEPRSNPNLEDAMARLPEQQREAFSMLKLEGLSIEQAADRAGITVGALRVRAHRAYKTLRKLISE